MAEPQTLQIILGAPRYPVLNAFMRCRARVSAIMGPLGSGKTFGCIQRVMKQMTEQEPNAEGIRPTRFCCVRNVYNELMSTAVKDWIEVFTGLGKMKYGGLEPPTFHVGFALEDGTRVKSEMIFLALDRPDAVRKLRGMQVTGFWLNEMKELVKPIVDMADLRHGRYPSLIAGGVKPTWHGMMGDLNAPDDDHWFYRLAEEDKPKNWVFFRQPGGLFPLDKTGLRVVWGENTKAENLENLLSDYYTQGQQAKDDDWISVNLANEYGFVVEGRPVHPQYVDSVHGAMDVLVPDRRYPLILGIDFGRTPACVFTQHHDHVGRWVVYDEFLGDDMSAALFAPELKRYIDRTYSGFEIRAYGDPAGDSAGQTIEETPIQVCRASGIPVQPCSSNNVLLRRAAIARPCMRNCTDMKPAFLVSPKAKITRKGLRGGFCYRRMKVSEEKYTEEPDKNMYSHPVEACEYALLGGGEKSEALRPFGFNVGSTPRQQYAITE